VTPRRHGSSQGANAMVPSIPPCSLRINLLRESPGPFSPPLPWQRDNLFDLGASAFFRHFGFLSRNIFFPGFEPATTAVSPPSPQVALVQVEKDGLFFFPIVPDLFFSSWTDWAYTRFSAASVLLSSRGLFLPSSNLFIFSRTPRAGSLREYAAFQNPSFPFTNFRATAMPSKGN